jgi:hypothetical protein
VSENNKRAGNRTALVFLLGLTIAGLYLCYLYNRPFLEANHILRRPICFLLPSVCTHSTLDQESKCRGGDLHMLGDFAY